jgi:hypothetical protein
MDVGSLPDAFPSVRLSRARVGRCSAGATAPGEAFVGQGMGETVPAQNIARITRTMTDVNNASFDSLVICVPSFVRPGASAHHHLTFTSDRAGSHPPNG